VIREADSRRLRLSQFDILKTLFLADKVHLNAYGRPITFDEYVAMTDGPVPSLAYDLLKDALSARREAEMDVPLWRWESDGEKRRRFFDAVRDASDAILSETDREELTRALTLVKKWGYQKTWVHVHNDEAYKDAWSKRGQSDQHPMNYSLLFDNPDEERAEDLKFVSAHL
jgi:uncharacterized phage-associated protein